MAPSCPQPERQFDLFTEGGVVATNPARPAAELPPQLAAEALDDDALIAALPHASLADCRALTAEAGRRRLTAAVAAIDALCRRFKGFGLHHAVPEQVAALQGLAAIGGRAATTTVAQLITEGVVQGPGLKVATGAAVILGSSFPSNYATVLLRHADPAIRADACRCAPPAGEVVALLVNLLDDLHIAVAEAAACALGRMGRPEAAAKLARLIREKPSAEVIEAIAPIADDTTVVVLGRLARTDPGLTHAVLGALSDIDTPRAAAMVTSIRSDCGIGRDGNTEGYVQPAF